MLIYRMAFHGPENKKQFLDGLSEGLLKRHPDKELDIFYWLGWDSLHPSSAVMTDAPESTMCFVMPQAIPTWFPIERFEALYELGAQLLIYEANKDEVMVDPSGQVIVLNNKVSFMRALTLEEAYSVSQGDGINARDVFINLFPKKYWKYHIPLVSDWYRQIDKHFTLEEACQKCRDYYISLEESIQAACN